MEQQFPVMGARKQRHWYPAGFFLTASGSPVYAKASPAFKIGGSPYIQVGFVLFFVFVFL